MNDEILLGIFRMIDRLVGEVRMFRSDLASFSNDPLLFPKMIYDLNLIVERAIKVYLDLSCAGYKHRHDIPYLIDRCECSNSQLLVTDWLKNNAETFYSWGARGRYDTSLYLSLRELKDATNGSLEFLCLNGFTSKLFKEVTTDVIANLSKIYPPRVDVNITSNAVKNVLYCVHMRKLDKPKTDLPKTLDEYFERNGIENKEIEIARLQSIYHVKSVKELIPLVYKDLM